MLWELRKWGNKEKNEFREVPFYSELVVGHWLSWRMHRYGNLVGVQLLIWLSHPPRQKEHLPLTVMVLGDLKNNCQVISNETMIKINTKHVCDLDIGKYYTSLSSMQRNIED